MKDFLQKKPKTSELNASSSRLNESLNTSDYYSAPTSAPFASDNLSNNSYNDSRWYSLEGRVGRVRFLAISMIWGLLAFLIVFILMVLSSLFGNSASSSSIILVYIIIILMSIYTSLLLPRRRLHDLDKSGWLILLAFIPLVNLLFYLYLIFARGDEGINRFGLPPAPYSRGEVWLVTLPLILFVLAMVAAIMMPSYFEGAALENQAILEEAEAQIQAQANKTASVAPSTAEGSTETLTYEEFMEVSEEEIYYESATQQ